jgi:D-alanine-D-alanine ligase
MDKKIKLKIAVIMGGHSEERDVSLASGMGVVGGLMKAGHEVIAVDTALGKLSISDSANPEILTEPPSEKELAKLDTSTAIQTVSSEDLKDIDVVFIALHGGMGENGTIQALLDILRIPYTGSGVLASAIGMDKVTAKRVVQGAGVPTPGYIVKNSEDIDDEQLIISEIEKYVGFPVVVKPNDQGSSVGLNIADSKDVLFEYAKTAAQYSDKVLFEKMIEGRELTVSVLGNEVLPVAEVIPEGGFYDYHHKYTPGLAKKLVPAPLTDKETETVQNYGLTAFKALGCTDYARIDFRLSPEGEWYFLEVNTLPGMTPTSLVPKAAKAAGIDFHRLLDKIIRLAYERLKKDNQE